MNTFDHSRHKLIAVDANGQHLHVTVQELERETREVVNAGEVIYVPETIVQRLITLEEFARAAAEKVNKIEADYHAARQDVAALVAKLDAILKAPHEFNLAPMAHYHDTKGVKAA